MIARTLSEAALEAIRFFPVLTITGPRQSGKTTLIKELFKDYSYFSMEDPDIRRLATQEPRGFLSSAGKKVMLDEVQRVPDLLSYIQGMVDNDKTLRFVLTGSANFSLLHSVTQSLAGRSAVLDLLPLSMEETDETSGGLGADSIILKGMYPAVQSGEIPFRLYYSNYVRTYLERDVRSLLNISDIQRFETFLRLCASRVGSLFNASELSAEVGVSVNTINSWLGVLQSSYIVYMLRPYHTNTSKRLVKTPKLYFTDTGLACYLLGIETEAQLSRDRMRGHLFENLMVIEALKHRFNRGMESNLWFFRNSRHEEVDLLIQECSSFLAIEIKSGMTFVPDFLKGFKALKAAYPDSVGSQAVVYAGDIESGGDVKLLNFKNFHRLLDNFGSLRSTDV